MYLIHEQCDEMKRKKKLNKINSLRQPHSAIGITHHHHYYDCYEWALCIQVEMNEKKVNY